MFIKRLNKEIKPLVERKSELEAVGIELKGFAGIPFEKENLQFLEMFKMGEVKEGELLTYLKSAYEADPAILKGIVIFVDVFNNILVYFNKSSVVSENSVKFSEVALPKFLAHEYGDEVELQDVMKICAYPMYVDVVGEDQPHNDVMEFYSKVLVDSTIVLSDNSVTTVEGLNRFSWTGDNFLTIFGNLELDDSFMLCTPFPNKGIASVQFDLYPELDEDSKDLSIGDGKSFYNERAIQTKNFFGSKTLEELEAKKLEKEKIKQTQAVESFLTGVNVGVGTGIMNK